MNTFDQITQSTSLAKSLAAEDICCGDMVTVLDKVYEYPSFLWNLDTHLLPPSEPVRIRLESEFSGKPLKVKAICLPYVLVKPPKGAHFTLDIRHCRLVRLSNDYAKIAWKQYRKKPKKKSK